jgi:hypothetical protein
MTQAARAAKNARYSTSKNERHAQYATGIFLNLRKDE